MFIGDHIRQQSATIPLVAREVRAQLRDLRAANSVPDRLILVGVGSSMNALVAGAEALVRATGATLEFREPMGFAELPPRTDGKPLVIAMSQGGQSASTVAAAGWARQLGLPCIAITANRGSEIARSGADIVELPIGEESIGPKTKGYTASVAGLLALADHFAGRATPLDALEDQLASFIDSMESQTDRLAGRMRQADFLTVCGRLGHVGTALEAALKIVEISGLPSVGLDVEEAMHGRFHAHSPRSFAVIITRDAEGLVMAQHTARILSGRGTQALICDVTGSIASFGELVLPWPTANFDAGWDVLWAVIPFQMLAAAFARARGIPPERMVYPGLGSELGTKIIAA